MKLKNLILYNKYRSLQPFPDDKREINIGKGEKGMFLKHPLLYGHIDPICLVGENGCGKSNLLELLADIFFEVDKFFLEEKKFYTAPKTSTNYFAYANQEDQTPIYFQLVYEIGEKVKEGEKVQKGELIKIERKIEVKKNKKGQKESVPKIKFYRWNDNATPDLLGDKFELLPTQNIDDLTKIRDKYIPLVVSYTSGLNDLVTLPFIDIQDFYAQQVAKEANKDEEDDDESHDEQDLEEYVEQNKEETVETDIPSPNLLLLNYESNASIVVSNFLLASEDKCKVFAEMLRIQRMNSFRIIIRLNKLAGRKKVKITQELQGYIDKLRKCAALVKMNSTEEKGLEYTFDFVVNKTTKQLFERHFKTVQKLFEALTKLNLLNTLCVKSGYRDELKKKRKQGRLVKFPQVATLDKIFSIEKIELVLTTPQVRTEYEKISDGEHQFIHIIGGIMLFDKSDADKDILYLLDEPDTHFNPLWRTLFFYQLENVLEKKNVEFVITTHSPFILSDCHGYNVFKFTREGSKVSFTGIERETYGATYENVTEILFNTIDKQAKSSYLDLEKLYTEIDMVNSKEEWNEQSQNFLKRIRMFGESLDKLYVLKKFAEKEETFKPKNP